MVLRRGAKACLRVHVLSVSFYIQYIHKFGFILLWTSICVGVLGDMKEGEVEVVADTMCFCEWLWHHQHNERLKSVEGEKAIYSPTAKGDSPPPLIIRVSLRVGN